AAADGRLLGLKSRVVSDAGAYHIYPLTAMLEPLGTASILPGPYLTAAYAWEAIAVATHKPPLGAYRGVGMTMGAFVMERLVDLVATRLGLDPAEVRRRNLIPRESYPHLSPSGLRYDSGDFPKALEQALAAVDPGARRAALGGVRERRRARGRTGTRARLSPARGDARRDCARRVCAARGARPRARAGARGDRVLRSARTDVLGRRAHRHGRARYRIRTRDDPTVRRGGGLRAPGESDDRRGADSRRGGAGDRRGVARARRARRGGSAVDRDADGLRAAESRRRADV